MTITNVATLADLDSADQAQWHYVESEKRVYYWNGSAWVYVDVCPVPLS